MRHSASAAAAILLALVASGCARAKPPLAPSDVAASLTYSVPQPSQGLPVSRDLIISMIEKRLDALDIGSTLVTAAGQDRIIVGLGRSDDATIDRVKNVLSHRGHVEFRVLADSRTLWDSAIIEWAESQEKNDKGKDVVVNPKGMKVAEWVRLPADGKLQKFSTWVQRSNNGETEILAILDGLNVTGKYLKDIFVAKQTDGQPYINFSLDEKGGKLLANLTGRNLPQPNGLCRWLGIIVDRQLITAATIRSVIRREGEITGNFSRTELNDLVALLNAGEFATDLHFVSEAKMPGKK